ncbi:hypothetical protein [Anabaena sp. CCY 0017]|uniref:hypothetical protein n=1 Tax=Anabaena sp. CCY 0017 TaxID=3103866 RepID=UPI0039C71710
MQLQTALTAMGLEDAIIVSGGKVMIDAGVITGESLTALTQETVVEFLYKIRDAAGRAQVAVNEGQIAGEQLDSFPAFSYSAPTEEGVVGVTQVSSFNIPLNLDTITGPNV